MAFENLKLIYGASDESSFITKYFEDFYSEVIRFKDIVLSQSFVPTQPTDTEEEQTPAEKAAQSFATEVPAPERIISSLVETLNNQSIDSARYGGEFAEKYYNEAQFVMAALADEIFLHIDWPGKKYWENNLIESRLYNTHLAGETFFKRLDEFLKLRDPSRSDIAMIYLLALGLGFKGKYRGPADKGKIAGYKRELFIFINHRDPTLFNLNAHMFPDAYLHTLEGGSVQYLNDWRPWVIIFLSILAAMIITSIAVWSYNTSKTNELMNSIFLLTKK